MDLALLMPLLFIGVPDHTVIRSIALSCSARSGRFVKPDQADATSPVPFAKIFRFTFDPNHFYNARIPARYKGAFRDRHERRAGTRWTRVALLTRAFILADGEVVWS